MIHRTRARWTIALAGAALFLSVGVRAERQQPTAPAGPTAAEKYKNIQVLKTIPADEVLNTMQYIAASLGVQCGFCHVQGPDGWHFDSDDRRPKATARKMIQMVNTFNAGDNGITIGCATCHHGHNQPERTPPLAQEMTPDEARLFATRQAGRGGPGGGAPGGQPAPGRGAQGAPGAAAAPGGGRGPQRPTETVDQVVDKYVQALGGADAVARAKTRVMHGTVTTRELQTLPITVKETAEGAYRIDTDAKPQPTVRAFDGTSAWVLAFGNVRDLDGLQAQQVARPADFALPTTIKQRYARLAVQRYGNIDGVATIALSGRPAADVTEQLQFDRETGLLLRRTIVTRTALGNLLEQVDYGDYRDAGGVKAPFQVRYATWRDVNTEKFTDAKVNAPVDASEFAKPAGK